MAKIEIKREEIILHRRECENAWMRKLIEEVK